MSKFAIVCLCFALLLCGGQADGEQPMEEKDEVYDSYRLPTAITPENYKLEVITHLNDTEGFLFRGIVWITVRTGALVESPPSSTRFVIQFLLQIGARVKVYRVKC